MLSIPPVKSAMTAFPYAVQIDAPLAEAQQLMRDHGVRHLPVKDGNDLAGIVTDRDIKLLLGPDFDYPKPEELTVADACERDAYAVDLDTPLDRVALEMARRHIGSALITRNGGIVGMFTSTDACRELGRILERRRGGPDHVA